jgi:hypothetical protein
MKREYTSLWAAVQDLNKLDATKEKAIGTLLDEKLKSDRKLTRAQMQYQKLQDELAALDEDLLSTARKEGILTSLNEEKTPILAKKLKFGDGGPSSVSPVTAMPTPAPSASVEYPPALFPDPLPARARSVERGSAELEPGYLQPTIATHGQENPHNRTIKRNKHRNRSISPGGALRGSIQGNYQHPLRSKGDPSPARGRSNHRHSREWAESDAEQELRASLSELDDRLNAKSPNRSWL